MNNCIFVGRVGKDAELQYLPNGNAIVKSSLAINQYAGNGEYETVWVNYTLFGTPAENYAKLVKKGDLVSVVTKYGNSRVVDGKGNTTYYHNFVVTSWHRETSAGGGQAAASQDADVEISADEMPF